MRDAELVQFMAETMLNRNAGFVVDVAAARCGGDTDRAWRLLEDATAYVLRGLPAGEGPSLDAPFIVLWRYRVKRSSLKAARRWVLVNLSHYGNKRGRGRFPSTDTMARDTGYTRRAVEDHLRGAAADGWVVRRPAGRGGRGWRHFAYQLVIPADVGNGIPQAEPWEREERWERRSRRKAAGVGNDVPNDTPEVGNMSTDGREPCSHEVLVNVEQQKKSAEELGCLSHTHEGAREDGTEPAPDAEPVPVPTDDEPWEDAV